MTLTAEALVWETTSNRIVDDISLQVSPGEFVGLIGPNGSGKSSLLRMIYRMLRPNAGRIELDGQDVWQLSVRENARKMGVVTQEGHCEFDFRAHEIVLMGRSPHKKQFERDNDEDYRLVAKALERVGALNLADRLFATLSGGEKQRILIARALAQQPRILVLDEPTNHLDIHYQFEIMSLIRSLGIGVIAALHELNIAAHYCDRLYLIKAGKLIACGPPSHVLTAELIGQVYQVQAEVSLHPRTGKTRIDFIPEAYQAENTTSP